MWRKIIIFICNISSFISYGDDIFYYKFTFLKTIPIGKEEGNIGFVKKIFGGMPHGPQNLFICNDTNVYVPDFANGRINVYDINLNFSYTIIEKENKMAAHVDQIYVDQDKNMVLMRNDIGLKKINKQGDTVFFIEKAKLPREFLYNKNFFLKENNIFYYNDNSYIESVSPVGKIENKEITAQLLNQINETKRTIMDNDLIKLKTDKKHIIFEDKYFSTSYKENKAFFKDTKVYFEKIKSLNDKQRSENKKTINISDSILVDSQFIGYDTDHNSYWKNYSKPFVFIYSNTGDIIDAFYFDSLKDNTALNGTLIHTAVAPNGDVYFMRNDENGSHFWRIERCW